MALAKERAHKLHEEKRFSVGCLALKEINDLFDTARHAERWGAMTLRAVTLNVGQSGISKIPAIFHAARDYDVICLQEINVNCLSIEGLLQQWRKLGYFFLPGPLCAQHGLCRVALLSRLPIRSMSMILIVVLQVLLMFFAMANCKRFYLLLFMATVQMLRVRRDLSMILNLVHGLGNFGFLLVILGWFQRIAGGVAHALDEPFEQGEPLPPTCTGGRRIDFGMSRGATELMHDVGVADHILVGYSFPVSAEFQGGARGPRRAVCNIREQKTIEARFLQAWCQKKFEELIEMNEVDEAWSLLSNAAEFALCSHHYGFLPRSEAWRPRLVFAVIKPPKNLNPLRPGDFRQRRLEQLSGQPWDYALRQTAVKGCHGLEQIFPSLMALNVTNAEDFDEEVKML